MEGKAEMMELNSELSIVGIDFDSTNNCLYVCAPQQRAIKRINLSNNSIDTLLLYIDFPRGIFYPFY